jgi:hypothetical protein
MRDWHTVRSATSRAITSEHEPELGRRRDALVDGTLARLMQGGEFTRLYTKWFQSPIPPKGINLNAPMSKELADNLKALSDKPAT